jgi:hypothetical protein
VLVALTSLLVGGFVTFRLVLNAKVHKRLDALREAGYPVTLQELDAAYATPPYGQNAAEYIVGAITTMQLVQDDERLHVPMFGRGEFPARTEPLGQETESSIVELVVKHDDTFAFVRRAAPLRMSRYPVDLTKGLSALMPHLSELRQLAQLYCAKAALHAERAEADLAIDTLTHALAVPRSLTGEPLLISQMVRISQHGTIIQTLERVVNRVELSEKHVTRVEEALNGAYDPNAMATALMGEACLVLDALHRPRQAGLPMWHSSGDEGLSLIRLEFCRDLGLLELSRLRLAEITAHRQAAARRPLDERVEATAHIRARINEIAGRDGLLKRFMPVGARFIDDDVADATRLRVARVALSVERYRLETGEPPARLDDLVPAFLDEIPQDPFDGRPLRYVRRPRGYVVYSIGKDRTDDGGKERPSRRRGPEPEPTYDITFIVER